MPCDNQLSTESWNRTFLLNSKVPLLSFRSTGADRGTNLSYHNNSAQNFDIYRRVASRLVAVVSHWAVVITLVEWLACETAAREVSRSNPGGGQFVSASKIKHHFYMWTSKRKRVLFIVCHFLETAFEKTHPNTWILSWINAQSHRHNNRACLRKNVWAVPWAQTFLSRDTSQLLWLAVIWIIIMFTIDWWNDSPSYVNTNVTWWVGNHLNIY